MVPQVDIDVALENGAVQSLARPRVHGKFLYAGYDKLYVRGVTYGTFRESPEGSQFPNRSTVRSDFASMAANGINSIRTYTAPPQWLLDEALERGLYVMVGLPWEQHITFLDDAARLRNIRTSVRTQVRQCANHPAILSYAIGNEIPASIVRWHGRERVQKFLESLYYEAKCEDPDALITYVNFPTTEYLNLDFLDFLSFNVYLEAQDRLAAYIFRLQNLAGERPLVMAEVGLDSKRNGEFRQAEVLDWQARTVFSSGCAGMFVFAWTDEWHRGGFDIDDWDFGLVTRDRRPKTALTAVRQAFLEAPFSSHLDWPRISVVVCSYNGARTIRETLYHLTQLAYPDYEVIVIDDGSTDRTAEIAREFDVRLISMENGGLSNARNAGMRAATGEIVAYCDDDAYPDPHWLDYLAHTYMTTDYAGVGGPNLPVPGDGAIAEAVANAPGGPMHVLLSDTEAEHIPGCNSSYRRECLLAVNGYDPTYRVAGDDVDLCWRIQQRGWRVGFHPAAVVWHHRRNSLKAYWKQQKGYGKAEALLERKWPEKYNVAGHPKWHGRLYSSGLMRAVAGRWRVYHGVWGSGLFQSLYEPTPGGLQVLARMPEWYLISAFLLILSLMGLFWRPLLMAVPLCALAIGLPLAQVIAGTAKAVFPSSPTTSAARARLYITTALLFVLQPLARLWGRMAEGLAPWRIAAGGKNLLDLLPDAHDSVRLTSCTQPRPPGSGLATQMRFMLPLPRSVAVWSEQWRDPRDWLSSLETQIRQSGAWVARGGDFENWDLLVQAGLLATVRVTMAAEEHGAGKQYIRLRIVPGITLSLGAAILLFTLMAVWAWTDHHPGTAVSLGLISLISAVWLVASSGFAQSSVVDAIDQISRPTHQA